MATNQRKTARDIINEGAKGPTPSRPSNRGKPSAKDIIEAANLSPSQFTTNVHSVCPNCASSLVSIKCKLTCLSCKHIVQACCD